MAAESTPSDRLGAETIVLEVVNESQRLIRVPATYPFWQCDWFLLFDRDRATGYRLDAPPGSFVEFGPHETRSVRLVPLVPADVAPPNDAER